jgi:hypothetical protein
MRMTAKKYGTAKYINRFMTRRTVTTDPGREGDHYIGTLKTTISSWGLNR